MGEEITNRLLAKLLSLGYGQVLYTDKDGKEIVTTRWEYELKDEDNYCFVKIRKWDSIKWKPAMKNDYFDFVNPDFVYI